MMAVSIGVSENEFNIIAGAVVVMIFPIFVGYGIVSNYPPYHGINENLIRERSMQK
jgi:hypothetical protein